MLCDSVPFKPFKEGQEGQSAAQVDLQANPPRVDLNVLNILAEAAAPHRAPQKKKTSPIAL